MGAFFLNTKHERMKIRKEMPSFFEFLDFGAFGVYFFLFVFTDRCPNYRQAEDKAQAKGRADQAQSLGAIALIGHVGDVGLGYRNVSAGEPVQFRRSAVPHVAPGTPHGDLTQGGIGQKEGEPFIARRKKFLLIPMDEKEAIEQMSLLGHQNFFVYYDINQNSVNVLYSRRDGSYGLIETEIG